MLNSAIRRKCKSHIESIHTSAGEFTSPNVIENLFNNHFSTLFSSLLPAYSSNFDFVKSCLFHFVPIMADEVLNILQLLNVDKVTGPDGISACILKVSASAIADSLAALFNTNLDDAIFPFDWKQANNFSVYLLTDYRPISILPDIAKVFESIVHQQVFSYFSSNNLLTPAQSGFCPGHSTQDLLLEITNFGKVHWIVMT